MSRLHHLFVGSAIEQVDDDGTLPLPAFIADAVDGGAEAVLLVGPHELDPCLTAFDVGHVPAIHADSERRRLRDEEEGREAALHFGRIRRAFGMAERARLDRSGRIRLTPWMRARARIGGRALLVGAGATFEIWDPDVARSAADPGLRDLAAFRINSGQD